MVIFRYVPYKRLLSYVIMSIIGFTMLSVYAVVLTWCTTLGFPEYTGNRIPVYTREKPPDTHVERLVQNIQRHNRELQYSKSGDINKNYLWTQADIRNFDNSESTNTPDSSIYLDGKSNVDTINKADNSDTMDNTDKNILQPSHQSGNINVIQYNNPRTFTKIRQKMSKKLPQALIIGVKKGGTRALLEFLRIHPDVRAPGPEPHFFDRNYDKGLEWYRHQMPSTLDGQLTMEKTPSYFVTKEVPQRIYNMSKNIKLIVVVRDPVTRAISDYTQAATKRPAMKPFEKMAFIDNTSRIVDTKWAAVKIGVYAKHLEKWLKYFPLRQIHFVNGEQLIANPAGEMAMVQDFLGLKRIVTDKHFYLNETRGFPCLKKPEGSGRPHCLGKTKGRQHPNVDPHVLQRLRDFFKPFNAKFYQLTGQSFNWN